MKDQILSTISDGLQFASTQRTLQHLGDRSTYIGMSDIAKMIECPRSALANKMFDNDFSYNDLDHALILSRGHWFEQGIKQALQTQKLNLLSQLEIEVINQGVPIKAHLDFVIVLTGERPKIIVLEVKSCENIPQNLYTSYEMQIYGQLGLLKACYDKPAFNLKLENVEYDYTRLSFIELCQKQFNLELPSDKSQIEIEGYILCLSMSEAKIFGAYLPDKAMLGLGLEQANLLWSYMQNFRQGDLDSVDYAKSFNPLCSYCAWNSDCPKFTGTNQPSLNDELEYLANLKNNRKKLEYEIAVSLFLIVIF